MASSDFSRQICVALGTVVSFNQNAFGRPSNIHRCGTSTAESRETEARLVPIFPAKFVWRWVVSFNQIAFLGVLFISSYPSQFISCAAEHTVLLCARYRQVV
jgi:hypothetical protein